MWDPYAQFETRVLPNGLTVYVLERPETECVAVGMIVHSGHEHDPIGQEGIAHFVEHMCSKNISLSRAQIDNYIKRNGVDAAFGSTYNESTRFDFEAPATQRVVKKMLRIYGEILCTAKLDNHLERERSVIIGEFNKAFPMPFNLELKLKFQRSLFNGFWLERSPSALGNLENIRKFSKDDLQGFYDLNYTPANISIICTGGFSIDQFLSALSGSAFLCRKPGLRTPLPTPRATTPAPLEIRRVIHLKDYISANVNSDAFDYSSEVIIPVQKNSGALEVLRCMLREVLDREIRQKRGWTYSAQATKNHLRHFEALAIKISAMPISVVDKIEHVVERCVLSLGRNKKLFEKHRHAQLARIPLYDPTVESLRDGAVSDLAKLHRIESRTEYYEQFHQMTYDDVLNILPHIRANRRQTVITRE